VPDIQQSLQQALAEWYAIERELGHGATATVYLARDLKHNRSVAVKVLSPELALAVRTERFLREIEIAAQLSHPHIVPLYDSGSASGFLYYVMPYVRGESVRDLLARGGPLPVEEALRIARQVAGALDHAHRHGVIHRDIKPGNILLEEGHARVADFGIARAVTTEDSQIVTQTGVTIGTPAYMSPEQASGEPNLDRRTDIYSLGCVLYEMLAGAPPFTGLNVQSVLTKHLIEPVPPLREVRPDLPEEVAGLVELALAKNRDDRFATAAEFAEALALQGAGPLTPTRTQPVRVRRRMRVPRWAAIAVVAPLLLAAVWVGGAKIGIGSTRPPLDSLRYLVLPFEYGDGVAPSLGVDGLLQDALRQWTGITVMGRPEAGLGANPLAPEDARDAAAAQHAGQYVRGDVSRVGDSLRLHVTVHDATADGAPVREGSVTLAPTLAGAGPRFTRLADQLLFDDTLGAGPGAVGTRSFPARRAYARGLAAVQEWNLGAADSAFVAATQYDPNYAQAHLWLAQVRFWGDGLPAIWRSSAERAAGGRERLSSGDAHLSEALLAFGRGEVPRACAVWNRLTQREPYAFPGWYGLANCLSRDDAVLRDRGSPSGWSFRSSYYRATKAYQRAFELQPMILRGLSGGAYASVRRQLRTGGNEVRFGRAVAPDTSRFSAHPAWRDDTLAFVPYPRFQFTKPEVVPDQWRLAVRRQRELFHDIATAWATALPESPDANEALAISLELLENPAAIDAIHRARALANTDAQRVRLAAAEVWMRVKFSVPSDPQGLTLARSLADSLLPSAPAADATEPLLLASLAALTGRAQLATGFSRLPHAAREWGVPPPLARNALPLLIFAAFGGPPDSLRVLEHEVDAAIDQRFLVSVRQEARMSWLVRPGRLAFPDHPFQSIPKLVGTGDYLIDAEAALQRGDTAMVRRVFADLRDARQSAPLSEVNLEGLYPEARLLTALEGPRAGITWLDGTLGALAATDPESFVNPANAAALVRAMALRADLADQVNDRPAARRWAGMVMVLWSDSDVFLQPTVRRMRRFATGAT
jgi:tRNA A-37 threonylcarbamoyl transferase component Bud32